MMKGLCQVSHYLGEMAIRIDCNQLGSIPNTNPGPLAMVALGHHWYNSGAHDAQGRLVVKTLKKIFHVDSFLLNLLLLGCLFLLMMLRFKLE